MATTLLRPDQTFYPSPRLAGEAPVETLAYMVTFDPTAKKPDALVTLDVDRKSANFGKQAGRVEMPHLGDELHHFGWNACSSALCPYAPHPHVERRYLLVPGLRSSRIYVFDVKPDPRKPKLVHTIQPEEIASRAGYSRPHTIHCGPDGIYVSALGAPDGNGPGGIFIVDHDNFSVKGRWELDRGPQELAYDFWWHLGYDTAITSEWGTPNMVEGGVNPEILLAGGYGQVLFRANQVTFNLSNLLTHSHRGAHCERHGGISSRSWPLVWRRARHRLSDRDADARSHPARCARHHGLRLRHHRCAKPR